MKHHLIKFTVMLSLLLIFHSSCIFAIDIIRINKGQIRGDEKHRYKIEIIETAMNLTAPEFGPYKIITQGPSTSIQRAILEIKSGKTINTYFAVTTNEWEQNTNAIKIPIRRGILNFRLLMINKEKLSLFEKITTIKELKKLKVGLRSGWATTRQLKNQGFNVVETSSYNGLFNMLSSGRIDYIPRGINEIYQELELFKDKLPNLMVEPKISLRTPTPFYIFVSPNQTRLAERLEVGLEMMVKNKDLLKIFINRYSQFLEKADLHKRLLINIKNKELPSGTPLKRKELWFEYDPEIK
jgi:ABC-type amino acid transport substrate-binding protein